MDNIMAASPARRMRCKERRPFPRNMLLNSRNARVAKHHHHMHNQQRQRMCRQLRTIANYATKNEHDEKLPEKSGHRLDVSRYGSHAREVHDAICGRLGHRPRQIPGHYLQELFNDLNIYVSHAQVDNMIQCARQGKNVGRKNGGSQYLTFGEFCLFSKILQMLKSQEPTVQQKQHQQQPQPQQSPQPISGNKCLEKFEVFLGGSCNPTTWRTDTAIPELQRHGITYYNPQVTTWVPELVALEHNAKQSACLLLYVVDSQTRSVVGMMEVAYLVASGRCVVLVAHPYRQGQSIMNEPITQSEYLDLMSGQTSLLALVKSQGIKVHNSLVTALQCTANILRNGSTNGMTADEQITYKLRKLREVFDSFDTNQTGKINLTSVVDAYQRLTRKTIDLRSLCDYLSAGRDADVRISFDQFCVLVAEFGVDDDDDFGADAGCGRSDEWCKEQLASHNDVNLRATNGHVARDGCEAAAEYDLFLGGSRAGRDWRRDFEPLLREKGITFCSPTAVDLGGVTTENTLVQLKRPVDNSRVLLFYISSDTRSLSSMILAAHYVGMERNVVLCIEELPSEGLLIAGETLTTQAIKDYNRGRVYLADMAKRKQIPVFANITEAVHAAMAKCREPTEKSNL